MSPRDKTATRVGNASCHRWRAESAIQVQSVTKLPGRIQPKIAFAMEFLHQPPLTYAVSILSNHELTPINTDRVWPIKPWRTKCAEMPPKFSFSASVALLWFIPGLKNSCELLFIRGCRLPAT